MKNILIPAICLLSALAGKARAQQAVTIQFTDGTEVEAEILNVTPTSLRWRMYPDGASVSQVSMDRIAMVDFVPTKAWEEAEEALSIGKYTEAGRLYSAIASDRNGNYYPVPGNFASLALKRIMTCHRRLLNSKLVAEISRQIEPIVDSLPKDEREFSKEDKAWIAAGNGDLDAVLKITKGATSAGTELSYLSAAANRKLGNLELALDGFTSAYTFGFGSHPQIARASLRGAAEILNSLDDEERLPELHSQLRVYQDLYGSGKLWEGASKDFVELAKADINTLGQESEEDKKRKNEPVKIVIPPLPDNLPPRKDREWLLAIEAEPAAYVYGKGAFTGEKETSPEKRGRDLYFSGAHFLKVDKVKVNYPMARFQAVFIAEKEDGVLFNVGRIGSGFTVYLKGGKLRLAFKNQGQTVKQFPLGPVTPGKQTTVVLVFNKDGTIKGQLSPESMKDIGKVTMPIKIDKPTTVMIAPLGKENNTMGLELPRFKGVIRHLAVGFEHNNSGFDYKEMTLFGGKRIELSVPKK